MCTDTPLIVFKLEPRSDVWNPMVKLKNEHPDEDVRKYAEMLLGQYNTAGGSIIKHELEAFLQKHNQ